MAAERTSGAECTLGAAVGGGTSASQRPWDALAWVLIGLVLALVCATFLQYGVAWDEQGETRYGSLLIELYRSGFKDQSAYQFVNFRFYGGGFELPAALLARVLPLNEYETRHLLGGLLGVIGLVATFRLGRRLFGARAGALALLLLALDPTFYGNFFNNARDIPFATGMTLCLLLTLRMLDEMPRLSVRSVLLFGMIFGWTTSVRVGGVLSLVFLVVPLALWFVARLPLMAERATRQIFIADALHVAKRLCLLCLVAYAVLALFWPWAVMSPLNPLRALSMFSNFPFDASVLFEGKQIPAHTLPASYLPIMLVIKQPELLSVALLLSAAFAAYSLWRTPRDAGATPQLRVIALLFAALFPIVYFVLARPVAYNGMRHFLFVLPAFSVLAAYGLDRLFDVLRLRVLRVSYGLTLAACALFQLQVFAELFPDEYVYYNSFVGGPEGAQHRFELDYWGMSLQETTERFVETLQNTGAQPLPNDPPYLVYVCGNVWSSSLYFPSWIKPVERIDEADYQIAIQEFFCQSPPGSQRVLDVTRDDAVLSYVDALRPFDRAGSRNRLAIHSRPTAKQKARVTVPAPAPRPARDAKVVRD